MPTLELTNQQVEALRKAAIVGCRISDIETALDRYPGDLTPDDCFVNGVPLGDLVRGCVDRISHENTYFSLSFLLRLIEHRWGMEQIRRGVTDAVPLVVRPPRGFEDQIARLLAALAGSIANIPERPARGSIGDAATFEKFCKGRAYIGAIVEALKHLDALKTLHDALHLLQVLGGAWLDSLPERSTTPADAATLTALLLHVETIAAKVEDNVPTDVAACCTRCREASRDAGARIGSDDPDEPAYARAALQALLLHELPLIDAAMFGVSRDLPLREFSGVFADLDTRLAVVDLGDTLRRRLMEHALWQATDLRLYAIEQVLLEPVPKLKDLLGPLLWVRSDLRLLFDPPTSERVIPTMNDTVLRCFGTGNEVQGQAGGALTGTLGEVRAAFAALRDAARSSFINVDQALKEDLASLPALRAQLQTVLDRVPPVCEIMLPE